VNIGFYAMKLGVTWLGECDDEGPDSGFWLSFAARSGQINCFGDLAAVNE
jgi:hypothetical protein